ncbi:GID complex subunit 4, VID24 [Thoreauomyces humboldtii]|nr:GID complex subunit 4, VID24 [Thoreauomyces humboldtii]
MPVTAQLDVHSSSPSSQPPAKVQPTKSAVVLSKPRPRTLEPARPRLIDRHCCSLFSGSAFKGHQTSGRNSYDVTVDFQHVDLASSFLCGYLSIKGLTEDYPDLCTFFEGEIIGPKHSFLTRKWDADEAIDRQHWQRFPEFAEYVDRFNEDGFSFDFETSDFIFMRWKVRCLVFKGNPSLFKALARC